MLPTIAKLASNHGIVPLKRYGQNFIFDETLCDKIVKASNLQKGDFALEIGPGPAGLSRSILKICPEKLIVIEMDKRFIPLLEEVKLFYPPIDIIYGDALKISLSEIYTKQKIHIISNLPYNIGTVLLINWLNQIKLVSSMTVMLQKEVAERIVAKVGDKSYGRLSVICQLICDVQKCFDVSPNAFYPKPKIWSSIVRLTPKNLSPDNHKFLLKVQEITNVAFSARRKMIKTSLKKLSPNMNEIIDELGLDASLRAENLSPDDYLTLAQRLL